MHNYRSDGRKLDAVGDDERRRDEQGRVSLVLLLVEEAVRDDLCHVIRRSRAIVRARGGDRHELRVELVRDWVYLLVLVGTICIGVRTEDSGSDDPEEKNECHCDVGLSPPLQNDIRHQVSEEATGNLPA